MLRIMVRGAVACLCAIAMAVALLPSVQANAAASSHSAVAVSSPSSTAPKTGGDCHVLHVYLHGTRPATSECLDGTQADSEYHIVSPSTSQSSCSSANVRLYEDINRGGREICFSGRGGIVNLAVYSCGLFCIWDNRASSFSVSVYWMDLYRNPNFVCPCDTVPPGYTGNLTGTVVGNDQLSSFDLWN